MKLFTDIIKGLVIGSLFIALVYTCTRSNSYRKFAYPQEYATSNIPEYKDSKRVAELKNEVETLRVKSLKLQAALDSCKYNITSIEVITPKVTYKAKKSKALQDCEAEVIELRGHLGEYVGAKAKMEVEKDLEINKLKRQMDTCAYFVQEMDKALLNMSNDVTKLTNEKDSLSQKLLEPVSVSTSFPCLKTKRGIVVTAKHQIIPGDERPAIYISLVENSKTDHKATKKSCRNKK